MWLTCCHWIISGLCYDYFHGGVGYDILEYYFGCHAAFGLLVVSMIIFMILVDVLLLLHGVLISEMVFTCGS